jgi:hypothetical protein
MNATYDSKLKAESQCHTESQATSSIKRHLTISLDSLMQIITLTLALTSAILAAPWGILPKTAKCWFDLSKNCILGTGVLYGTK